MSAYSNGTKSQIISLPGVTKTLSPDRLDRNSLLPQIVSELESYFSVAHQMENTLAQERVEKKKFQDQLQELQVKFNDTSRELNNKIEIFTLREKELQSQLAHYQKNEQELKKIELALIQERTLREKAQSLYRDLYYKFMALSSKAQENSRAQVVHTEQLKSQIVFHQENEKKYQNQIEKLSRQIENFIHEKKRTEIDLELSQAKFEKLEEKEETYRVASEQVQELKQKLQETRQSLKQYYHAWKQLDVQAKQVFQGNEDSRRKIQELTESLEATKRRADHYEELMKKEKRDKQIALSCLHTAEARLAHATREIQTLQTSETSQIQDQGLELNF
jgi:chromosome segregation ATPase